MNRFFSATILLVIFLCASKVSAQSLIITDCNGFTRAVKSVDPGSLNKVEVSVTDTAGNPVDGVETSLTNSTTGEVTTAVSKNGVATFENLATGNFSINTAAAGAKMGAISIGSMGAGAAAAAGAVVATGAVGGGAIAGVGVVVNDKVLNDEDDPTPTPVPTDTPIEPTPTPIPTQEPDFPCDPDEEVPPLDGFF